MSVTPHWYRLCVDVSPSGAPMGASWERRDDSGVNRIVTLSEADVGPFDTPTECFEHALQVLRIREGLQLTLFPS